MEDNKKTNGAEIIKKLRKGEEVICPECNKGKLVTEYDYKISHNFHCTECDLEINLD